jgi:hypothetical protein
VVDAAWIGAGGVLVGAVATALLNMRAEAKRSHRAAEENERQRVHDLDLRQLDFREQHRAALHASRRAAYADFLRSYQRYERATPALTRAISDWRRRHSGDAVLHLPDEIAELQLATAAVEESLLKVEVVASSDVASAARNLRRMAGERPIDLRRLDDDDDAALRERYEDWFMFQRELEAVEGGLRVLMRAELELDR